MKRYPAAWTALLLGLIMLCSCSTVRKTTASHQVESRQTDKSAVTTGYTRETNVTETGLGHVAVPADSLSASGYVPAGDTGTVVAESDGMIITTTTVPAKDSSGKTIGNMINTKAKVKPRDLPSPINKVTHIKETGNSEEKKDIETTMKQRDKSSAKFTWHPSAGVQIVCGLVLVSGILFGIYKLIQWIKSLT